MRKSIGIFKRRKIQRVTGKKEIKTDSQTVLVSIVLCTYNGEAFLQQQLESLLIQSYQNIEIIAVDDRSSDKTVEILTSFAEKHPNMKVFVNEANLGFIRNFDKACSLASGQFIAPCDQDDYWEPAKIEKLMNHIGDAPMIYSDSFVCDESLNKKSRISDKINCQNYISCLQQCIYCRIYGHATLISKAVYEKASPFILDIPHDWWLCYTATLMGGIKYYNEPLVYYRQHAANAIGVIGEKKRKHHKHTEKGDEKEKIRNRVKAFYEMCPDDLTKEKKILFELNKSYQSFSLANNIKRMTLFFNYFKYFLAPKKRSLFMNYLFCFKMFIKIK